MQIFSFNGYSTPTKVTIDAPTGLAPSAAALSPNGAFAAIVSEFTRDLLLFSSKNVNPPIPIGSGEALGGQATSVAWSKDGNFIATVTRHPHILEIFKVNYIVDRSTQTISNAVVFGNSKLGSNYDTTVKILAGANVMVDGLVNYDCVV